MRSDTLRRSLLAALLAGGLACASPGSETVDGTGGSPTDTGTGGNGSGGHGVGGSGEGGKMGAGGAGVGGTLGGSGGQVTGMGGARAGTGGRSGAGGAVVVPGVGGGGGTYTGTKTPGMAQAGDITVNPGMVLQSMDGFGIADVWQGKGNSTQQLLTLLFDPDKGIGLTLLRIGIDGTTGKIMGDAAFVDGPAIAKFGGKIWAAPWTPPANLKDNNNINNGGHLVASNYDTWASTLAAFPAYYKQQSGVDLWGISAQNEPDFVASYQSCIYSAAQMNAFIKVLGPKLKALNPPVKLLAAEPDVWSHIWNNGDKYGSAIIGDPTVSALVDVIATHDYGSNGTTRPTPPAGVTQRLWETEITYSAGGAINAGLDIARGIYAAIMTGGVNGWLYWWTQQFMDGGTAANPPKRVYAMGNFSKFVRPGYVHVGITGVPSSVQIVPFYSPSDGTTVIVALNSGNSAVQASFFVSGAAWPGTVTPWVTSASSNLVAGTDITVTAGRFSASLGAQSVTTFVGKP